MSGTADGPALDSVCTRLRRTRLTPYTVEVAADEVAEFSRAIGVDPGEGTPTAAPDIFAARFTIVPPGGEVYDLLQSDPGWRVEGLHRSQRYRFHRTGGLTVGRTVACSPRIRTVERRGDRTVIVDIRTECRDAESDERLVTSEMTMHLTLTRDEDPADE